MQTAIALLRTALSLRVATEAQILPAGEFTGRSGRPGKGLSWKLSDQAGQALAAKLSARHASTKFNFDYEHQTMLAEKNGQPAPAAGWAQQFVWRDGEGLFAAGPQWNDRAKQMIEAGEYLYISPVIVYNTNTGAVSDVLNAALVNVPDIIGMEAVAKLSAQASADADALLTDDERAVCRATNTDPADFVAARDEQAAAACRAPSTFNGVTLNDEELAVCSACGITPAAFAATKAAQLA
jgi:phage I-like protein